MNNEQEVKQILMNKNKVIIPENTDNIINWNTDELKAYIKHNIKGMSIKKKMKFGKEITALIKKEKEKLKE